jgi:hypothetical protein
VRLGNCIQWYVSNRCNVLLAYDSRLANFHITTTNRTSRNQQQQWVKHLDIAREAYTLELRQRAHSQNLITRYMVSTSKIVHDTLESDFEDNMDNNQEDSSIKHHSNSDKHTREAPNTNNKRRMLHQNTMTGYMMPRGHSNNEWIRTNVMTRYTTPREGIQTPHDWSNSVTRRDAQQNWTGHKTKNH